MVYVNFVIVFVIIADVFGFILFLLFSYYCCCYVYVIALAIIIIIIIIVKYCPSLGFIDSVRDLLRVRSDASRLKQEVINIDREVRGSSAKLIAGRGSSV